MTRYLLLVLLLSLNFGFAQVRGRIVDAKSGESIPYANIKAGNDNMVSNEEGWFTISEANSGDDSVIAVSYLGYVARQLSVSDLRQSGNLVKLEMGIVELDNVNVSNQKPDPKAIMAKVRANLKQNYANDGNSVKNTIFFRESSLFKPSIMDVEIDRSTGFNTKQLDKANSKLGSLANAIISHPPIEYTDMLCNYYRGTTKADKPVQLAKFEVVKGIKLKNENRAANLDELQKQTTEVMLQHLDTMKYYRIKSGLIGSRDTVSLRKDFNKKKNAKRPANNNLTSSKAKVMNFMTDNSLWQSKNLDFARDGEIYEYTYEGATYNGNEDFVYVIGFKPRKGRAKYEGKLYVSDTDFAVLRADYELVDGKKVAGLNLKFLLGVKFAENVSKGTLIYRRNQLGDGYYLQYGLEESGQYMYLNRPLKFIELTEEREEDVVKFELKIEANTRNKTEYLNLSRTETSADAIAKYNEEDFKFVTMNAYDPNVWKDYGAIEPVEAMKQFRAVN